MSPNVFTTALEAIFKKLSLLEERVKVDGGRLRDPRFADDATLKGSFKDMETQLNGISKESMKVGLEDTQRKNYILSYKCTTNFKTNENIQVEYQEIEIIGGVLKEEVLRRFKNGAALEHTEIDKVDF